MRKLLLIIILTSTVVSGHAQKSAGLWNLDLGHEKSFIINQGQFDGLGSKSDRNIEFAVDNGSSMVLFNRHGLTYRFTRKVKNTDRKRGDRMDPKYSEYKELVSMEWLGANPNVIPQGVDMVSDPHSYSVLQADHSTKEINNIRGFSRIIYRNLYPNIDVSYEFHEDVGIKYTVILHPGADASKVRMRYSGSRGLTIDREGDLLISTGFGDITDHVPNTFFEDAPGQQIGSSFDVQGNTVGFRLSEHASDRTLLIDPWTTTPVFPNSQSAWDIDVDNNSNVYVYGGDTPMRLKKYGPAGNLLWTYTTPWDSANYWMGTMITDPTTGDCYITAGTDPVIKKINTSGTQVWTANGNPLDEYWKFSFNCDFTRLMLGGTRLTLGQTGINGYGQVFEMNMSNGSVINNVQIAAITAGPLGLAVYPNEVRAMCYSANGKYYYMTLDTIGSLSSNLNLGYQDIHGYTFSYQVAGYGVTNQSINAMAATTDFIYTQNGSVLDKRSIVDGSIVASATIPGGTTASDLFGFNSAMNSGLALDSCGYVYAGSGNGVYKFDADLIPVTSVSTPGAVYDVSVNHNGEIVACGQGFVSSLDISACMPPQVVCTECLELTPAGPYCDTDVADTLIADPVGGIWSGLGILNASVGIFDPSVAGEGTHTVFFTPNTPLVCGADSLVIDVIHCVDLIACLSPTGDVNVLSGTGPYTWSELVDTLDCSACIAIPGFPPCDFPPGCSVSVTDWVEFATGATATPTGNWPIRVVDVNGNSLQINAISELDSCSQGCFITVNVPTQIALCDGASDGEATAVVNGAIGAVSYDWNTAPAQTTATATGLGAGTFTVTVTDQNGCDAQDSVTVFSDPPIVISILASDTICSGSMNGTLTASASGGSGTLQFAWNTSPVQSTAIATGLAPGSFTFTASDDLGCMTTLSATVESFPPVMADAGGNDSICSGQQTVLSASGGQDYLWSTGDQTAQLSVTPDSSTVFWVTVTDVNGCTGIDTATVWVVAVPQVSVAELDSFYCMVAPPFQINGIPPGGTFVGDGMTSSGTFDPMAAGAGVHQISYQYGELAECYGEALFEITVDEHACDIVLPNVFNPNSDFVGQTDFCGNTPQNNVFALPCLEMYPGNRMTIYNRWGRKLYDRTDYHLSPWDGGNEKEGVYYYILQIPGQTSVKGYFQLVR